MDVDCAIGGGEGEIRTRGWIAPTPVFKTGALNRSATSPVFADVSGALRAPPRRFDSGHPALRPFGPSAAPMFAPASAFAVKTGALNRSATSPVFADVSGALRTAPARPVGPARSILETRKVCVRSVLERPDISEFVLECVVRIQGESLVVSRVANHS